MRFLRIFEATLRSDPKLCPSNRRPIYYLELEKMTGLQPSQLTFYL